MCRSEKEKISRRIWRKNNIEKERNQRREWARNNPNKVKEYQRKYGENNRNKLSLYQKVWKINNPAKVRLNHQKYKYNKKQAGKLTIQIIQLVYEDNIKRYGTLTCYLCLQSIFFGNDHLEHKIPLSRGGTNEYNNLGIACRKCNLKKHNRTEGEFKTKTEE